MFGFKKKPAFVLFGEGRTGVALATNTDGQPCFMLFCDLGKPYPLGSNCFRSIRSSWRNRPLVKLRFMKSSDARNIGKALYDLAGKMDDWELTHDTE